MANRLWHTFWYQKHQNRVEISLRKYFPLDPLLRMTKVTNLLNPKHSCTLRLGPNCRQLTPTTPSLEAGNILLCAPRFFAFSMQFCSKQPEKSIVYFPAPGPELVSATWS